MFCLKDFVNKENPATVSSRKTPNSCETKTSVESKLGRTTRNNDTKTMSAVNTQLVADKSKFVIFVINTCVYKLFSVIM